MENYPKGELTGFEFEVRQGLGRFWSTLDGLALGANATFIDSKVDIPDDEIKEFANLQVPMTSRDMTDAPENLYNLFMTYDLVPLGSQFALFYTVTGDTLVAGAGQAKGNFVPSIYAKEYGTLNFSYSQRLWEYFKLTFKAKNLTNPDIETVYRSQYIGSDVTRSSYTAGVDYSVSISAEVRF